MWQALREELHPKGIEIVTVALDTGGAEAARPYIEAAKPTHPSLIDRAHLCDELLGVVNVPNSVWIDEHGMIVRPAEPAWPGSTPVLDMLPALTAEVPPERKGVIDEIRRFHITPEVTVTMLRDWAERGADSQYVLSPDEVIARSRPAASTRPPRPPTSSSPSTSTSRATTPPRFRTSARRTGSIRRTGRTSARPGASRPPTPRGPSRRTARVGWPASRRSAPSSTTRRSRRTAQRRRSRRPGRAPVSMPWRRVTCPATIVAS